MRYYLVAGEASGDLHGSNLMRAILAKDPDAQFRFWGGDLMQAAGGTLVSHYKNRAFMGLWEVISNLRTIARFLEQAKKDIRQWNPDALILIDNPGFNMRLARFASELSIPVHYYIAPKVWAWNTGRVKGIKKYVSHLYSILPFEPAFFSKFQVPVDYVGNPVLDAISAYSATPRWKEQMGIEKPIIALLPGSRRHEIAGTLPLMASLQTRFKEYQFVVAAAPGYNRDRINQMAGTPVMVVENDTYNVLAHASAAMVASGTATLETAIFNVPQLVCYRVSPITWWIGKKVIKVKWVSLVNLILGRELVRELLQHNFNQANCESELRSLLAGPRRNEVLNGYRELNGLLGKPGASENAAELMVSRIKNLHLN
ncbi:MAG: lipid-A-disaccharide synthase [Bacteroidia bacterium]|nr:lipid-A-disaccharide synthase [Bacteroidia bacterium]